MSKARWFIAFIVAILMVTSPGTVLAAPAADPDPFVCRGQSGPKQVLVADYWDNVYYSPPHIERKLRDIVTGAEVFLDLGKSSNDKRALGQEPCNIQHSVFNVNSGNWEQATVNWADERDGKKPGGGVVQAQAQVSGAQAPTEAPKNARLMVPGAAGNYPDWGANTIFGLPGVKYTKVYPGQTVQLGNSQLVTEFDPGAVWKDSVRATYTLPDGWKEVWATAQGDAPVWVKVEGNTLSLVSDDQVSKNAPASVDNSPRPSKGSSGVSVVVFVR